MALTVSQLHVDQALPIVQIEMLPQLLDVE